jgi:hypothetical protein
MRRSTKTTILVGIVVLSAASLYTIILRSDITFQAVFNLGLSIAPKSEIYIKPKATKTGVFLPQGVTDATIAKQ